MKYKLDSGAIPAWCQALNVFVQALYKLNTKKPQLLHSSPTTPRQAQLFYEVEFITT